ncbi:WSC-domain-containing protein [Exidia glandulosa HHB12029]|uniref:WSC-domain-containing protein n=1 Tax=Exidia glandulosa HHB12029 TaxID=1314781 RepID=A0A165LVT2_EXIGL|nr:WSC-domain-containing protein [Exidia glandulosa HHB12029]
MFSLALVALTLAAAASPADAFFRMNCAQPVTTMRADPITFADARKSSCSTCQARSDLSNYWTPNLYYRAKNGSFHNVNQIGGGTVYYLQRRGTANEKLHAFPEGFRMLAGTPGLRSYDANSLAQRAISFNCLDFSGKNSGEFTSIPGRDCPNGLRAQVFFPSCWDGKNVDSADHKSHMAYPDGEDSGSCPSSHPVRLISIFYEITFDIHSWNSQWWTPAGATHPFVLSNGDPTGYGWHGDFLNGWDVSALQVAIDGCNQESGVIEDCQSILPLRTNEEMTDCVAPSRVPEATTGWLKTLPGCNPVSNGPANAVPVSGCGAPTSILSTNQASFLRSDIAGWQPIGCARDDGAKRVLTDVFTNGAMTVDTCTAHCKSKGFSFAGLEWAQECWCGNSLDQSTIGNYACDMECQGDAGQFCGASQRLAVYKAGNYSPPPAATFTVAPAPPAAPTTFTTKPTSSAPAAPSTKPTTAAIVNKKSAAAGDCSTACVGNGAQACGAGNRINIYQSTSSPSKVNPSPAPAPAAGWSATGCFTDNVAKRVLTGAGLWAGQPMTPAVCQARCASLGFKLAGVEYGQECYCGNSLVNGAAKVDAAQCSMACKGDGKQKCGAADRIQVFQRTTAKREHRRRRLALEAH